MFLLGESHGQRSLVGYSRWGHKESDPIEQLTHTHTHIENSSLGGNLSGSLRRKLSGPKSGNGRWVYSFFQLGKTCRQVYITVKGYWQSQRYLKLMILVLFSDGKMQNSGFITVLSETHILLSSGLFFSHHRLSPSGWSRGHRPTVNQSWHRLDGEPAPHALFKPGLLRTGIKTPRQYKCHLKTTGKGPLK